MNQYCHQCDPDDGMESVQVAAITTRVLLGLVKEFSASSAQSSATKGEHYAFDNAEKKRF